MKHFLNQLRSRTTMLMLAVGLFCLSGTKLAGQIITPDCDNSYSLCTGDAVKLEPNNPTGFTNFVWYANSVAPGNQIDATTAASFFVDAGNPMTNFANGVIVVTRPVSGNPVAAPTAITYILTAEYTAPPGGCAALLNQVEVNFLPVPNLTAAPATICTASPSGQSINLTTLITDSNNTTGTVNFYPTLADAENQTNALGSTTVAPASTTSYFARKNTTATDLNNEGCFDIVEVVITVECLSLGNQVWYDTNNDGDKDAGELPIEAVTVNLYFDADGNGTLEDNSGSGGANELTAIATDDTDPTGLYLFENLKEGAYFVGIPASELATGGTLENLYSSGTTRSNNGAISEATAPDPDLVATDNDDNGTQQTGGPFAGAVLTNQVMLAYGTEPIVENPDNSSNPDDDNDNLTVDFGFYGMSIGSLVFMDIANDGSFNAGTDMGIAGVPVKLYSQDGTTLIATTTTGADGRYLFTDLPAGSYIAAVETNVGALSGKQSSDNIATSTTPNTTDNDDNGTSLIGTEVWSNVFDLVPGNAPTGESDQAQTTGAGMGNPALFDNDLTPDNNSNLHVDFGFKGDCPTISNPSADQTICAVEAGGLDGANITVSTSLTAANSVRFVRFSTQQTGSAMYTGGTDLEIVTPSTGTATYTFDIADFPNTGSTPVTYFVYAVMEPASPDVTCRPFQEIEITVNPRPTATPATLTQCETTAGGGTAVFALSGADATVLNGQIGMTLTYHDSQVDADNDANPITTKTAPTASTVFARVETANGCYQTSAITLNVNLKPVFTLSLPAICPGDNPVVQIALGAGADPNPGVTVNGGTSFAYSTLSPAGRLTTANGILVSANNTVILENANGCTNSQSIVTPAVVSKICLPVKLTKL